MRRLKTTVSWMQVCSSSSRCITQTMSCRFRPCLKLKWREICYTNMESRISSCPLNILTGINCGSFRCKPRRDHFSPPPRSCWPCWAAPPARGASTPRAADGVSPGTPSSRLWSDLRTQTRNFSFHFKLFIIREQTNRQTCILQSVLAATWNQTFI